MPYPVDLTPEERTQFEDCGFFVRERVFSEEELEGLRDAAENVHQQVLEAARAADAPDCEQIDNQRFQPLVGSTIKWEWNDDLRAVRSMEPVYHLDPRIEALVDDRRLWGPCRELIGSEGLSLFSDKLNVKRPGGAPFPWHQEGPYWAYGAEDLERIVTLIVYFDDATRENGCLWVISGSHRYGPIEGLKDRGVIGALYTDVDRIEGEAVPIEAPAGSVAFFHTDIVHGSQTNRSQTDRRAFLAAYQPAGLHTWRDKHQRDISTPPR